MLIIICLFFNWINTSLAVNSTNFTFLLEEDAKQDNLLLFGSTADTTLPLIELGRNFTGAGTYQNSYALLYNDSLYQVIVDVLSVGTSSSVTFVNATITTNLSTGIFIGPVWKNNNSDWNFAPMTPFVWNKAEVNFNWGVECNTSQPQCIVDDNDLKKFVDELRRADEDYQKRLQDLEDAKARELGALDRRDPSYNAQKRNIEMKYLRLKLSAGLHYQQRLMDIRLAYLGLIAPAIIEACLKLFSIIPLRRSVGECGGKC